MSFLQRLWRSVLLPTRYVGRDLEGNRFYEHPSSSSDPRRTKRTVKYQNPDAVWEYTGGGKRLPIQWSAWMTHTRSSPPSLEELQADVARQQRVLANAAKIEAEHEERSRQLSEPNNPQSLDAHLTVDGLAVSSVPPPPPQESAVQTPTLGLEQNATQRPAPPETESWTPRANIKRGS